MNTLISDTTEFSVPKISRSEWDGLGESLELLTPTRFTDRIWAAIEGGFEPKDDNAFYREMPFTVAEFKEAARKTIYAEAVQRGNCETLSFAYPKPDGSSEALHDILKRDLNKIGQRLLNRSVLTPETQVGTFLPNQERFLSLHRDGGRDPGFVYLARIGGLPINIIRHARLEQTTANERRLIAIAREQNPDNIEVPAERVKSYIREAIDELCRRGVVEPAPLNAVMLAYANQSLGTLHGSCPIARPTPSGYIRAFG
jgi:hypothetical protein